MPKVPNRFIPLTTKEQRHIVNQVIPQRIALVEACLREAPTVSRLTAAGIHARSLAGFLGIRADLTSLKPDRKYHNHGGGKSYEVKISDIAGGILFDAVSLAALDQADQKSLRVGFDTINREFAHLTFWSDPSNQNPDASPNDKYIQDLKARISEFADTVIRLVRQRIKGL